MSNHRYLDISSTYRNRSENPLPGEFVIPFSQSGRKGKFAALDPVSTAAPFHSWTSNAFTTGGDATISTTVVSTSSEPNTFIVSATSGTLQQIDGYYLSAVANDTTILELRRITGYKFLGNNGVTPTAVDLAEITVSDAFGSTFAVNNIVNIVDPTAMTVTNPLIFVPDGRIGENAYGNCILYNETLNEHRNITGYSNITHLLQIDTSTPLSGWVATDSFSIRKDLPSSIGTLVSSTTNSVTLPASFTTQTDFYRGDFVRITSGTEVGTVRRIVKYSDATTPSTIAIVNPPFDTSPGAAEFELLPFSYDNVNPLSYSGSIVSQQQEVCYEIELLNLILPNRNLESSLGSRIAFYPYVYVELVNVSGSSAGIKSVLYSNNPNAYRMLFKAAVDDIQNPLISSFVKIDGDGTVQTIKFRPNDYLRFGVYFSNGEVYQTIENDNLSPLPPLEELQVSALFSLKRL